MTTSELQEKVTEFRVRIRTLRREMPKETSLTEHYVRLIENYDFLIDHCQYLIKQQKKGLTLRWVPQLQTT